MLLRVSEGYLDFNGSVVVERHIKIFEEIDAQSGDFSYSASMPKTSNNMSKLGNPRPDVSSKTIYSESSCDLLDNGGDVIYKGRLRVDKVIGNEIRFSFFSGNYNWLSQLTGNVDDLDFSEYDTELEEGEIVNAMVNTEGITFPVIDTGALITRSYKNLRVEDFNGCMYLKTIFKKIFNSQGIKIQGELINDFLFNNTVVCKNNRSQEQIESRSTFALKTSTTTFASAGVYVKLTFDNVSTFPYFDGSLGNFSLTNERYTADVKMLVLVELNAEFSSSATFMFSALYKNGALYKNSANNNTSDIKTVSALITLEAGDYIEAFGVQQLGTGQTCSDATLKITPVFIYNVLGKSCVPTWTKQAFVSNVLNLFNVVSDYNPNTKTITFNLFDKIKSKTPVDISQYVTVQEEDYSEFISNYARKNKFSYAEGNDEELRNYNVTKFVKYGEGVLEVDNDFISESKDVISVDFKSPISYLNGVFDCSLERINLFELEESDELEFTGVTDSSGFARFTVANSPIVDLDLIRITDSTVEEYNGDWIVDASSATFIQAISLQYSATATGKIKKLTYKYTSNDDVFLFVNIPFYSVSNFSKQSEFYFVENTRSSLAIAYFNMLDNGTAIHDNYKQGLSFGSVDHPQSYQKTLLETYWRNFGNILSDPVKLKSTALFPKSVFLRLTPLTPVYLKTEQTTNLYYINRITGYQESHLPCEVELIKL